MKGFVTCNKCNTQFPGGEDLANHDCQPSAALTEGEQMKDIQKVSMAVQIDNQLYFVNLSQERLKILVKMAAGLSDSGELLVTKAPAEFKFITLGEA